MNKKQIQIGFRELTAATPGRVEISPRAAASDHFRVPSVRG